MAKVRRSRFGSRMAAPRPTAERARITDVEGATEPSVRRRLLQPVDGSAG